MSEEYRIEKDSMGEVRVPADALYGAQTQRAVDNFPVSGICISRSLIHSLGVIKQAAAKVNAELGNIPQMLLMPFSWQHKKLLTVNWTITSQ